LSVRDCDAESGSERVNRDTTWLVEQIEQLADRGSTGRGERRVGGEMSGDHQRDDFGVVEHRHRPRWPCD
jgi:hypothetical protein